MRVVQDGGPKVRPTIDGTAEVVSSKPAAAPAAKPGLPMMKAILFLIACIGGGVLIAVIRPFGLG
ncbi:hypothetical protein [Sphingomonas sp. KR3-1]|uniref:hypothetical protein n=1 Tax=Sphingomonas sp. KR3-1 TaxID=3156611 RepID=UPI0032B41AFC